jgi:hypothetical protein
MKTRETLLSGNVDSSFYNLHSVKRTLNKKTACTFDAT